MNDFLTQYGVAINVFFFLLFLALLAYTIPRDYKAAKARRYLYVLYNFQGSEYNLYNSRRGPLTYDEAVDVAKLLRNDGYHVIITNSLGHM